MNEMAEVFDQIAPGWYGFRHRSIFTHELEELARCWQKGRLLNLGCGHGPDFVPFREGFELYGVDVSLEMLKLARKYADKFGFEANLVRADMAALPFSDESFDWAIAAASLHHIRSAEGRLRALVELQRVLKPDGEAFITVWNRCQPRFWLKGRETMVPWSAQGKTVQRYYYLFTYGEIETLVRRAGLTLLRSFPESFYRFPLKKFSRNICLLVRKQAQLG